MASLADCKLDAAEAAAAVRTPPLVLAEAGLSWDW